MGKILRFAQFLSERELLVYSTKHIFRVSGHILCSRRSQTNCTDTIILAVKLQPVGLRGGVEELSWVEGWG